MSEVERLRAALQQILWTTELKSPSTLATIRSTAADALAPRQPTPDTRPALTARQSEVLAYIRESIATRGYAPTVREIGRHFGVANQAIQGHVRALEGKGYIRHEPGVCRTLSLVEAS